MKEIRSEVTLTEEQIKAILYPGMRFMVNDYEYGRVPVAIKKVEQRPSLGIWVTWTLAAKHTSFEYAQKYDDLVEYLVESKAEKAFGVGG